MSDTNNKSVCDALDQMALEAAHACPITGTERARNSTHNEEKPAGTQQTSS